MARWNAMLLTPRRVAFGLSARLLLLLLGFAGVPLAASIAIGYAVSRSIIVRQAQRALRDLVAAHASHLATELTRERLLLRTIAGQLPPPPALQRTSSAELGRLLVQGLPGGGVFDGLRVARSSGRVLASVALRDAAPHWPPTAPAADWARVHVVVHRAPGQDGKVLAYLLAVPAGTPGGGAWLEGHVRAEDFGRLTGIPQHLMGGVESAILDPAGPVFVAHDHAGADVATAVRHTGRETALVSQAEIEGAPYLVARASVEGTNWVYVGALPLELALEPLAQLRNAALLGAAILVGLIVVTAVLTSRFIAAPLRQLARAAQRFGQGEGYDPVRRAGRDEVAVLVQSFDQMVQDRQRAHGEIEALHAREMERAQQLATVGELASGVAHEIRNPLTGVLGAVELALRRLPGDDPSRPLLVEAQRQLRRIEETTTQLLQYARPPELREVTTDVQRLIERALHVAEAPARSAGVALAAEPLQQPALVRVDPELMVQVLVNLIFNGIQAMTPGGQMTVWLALRAPQVWIGVRDSGPGIPPERRADVFRPFFSTKHQGTGLGLSISRQIVERHGGELRYEDTPGGGATLIVVLPLAENGDRDW